MKRVFTLLAVMLFVVGVANGQTLCVDGSVCKSNVEKAFSLDLSNTDWFPKVEGETTTSFGLSLYNLDTVGTFDSFMRVNTTFDDNLKNMFQPTSHYGATYGATARVGTGFYGYFGLGFVSDFGHTEALTGTATYGAIYSGKQLLMALGNDTNVGATVSIGSKF